MKSAQLEPGNHLTVRRLESIRGKGNQVFVEFDPWGFYQRNVWIFWGEFRDSLSDGVLPPGSIWRIPSWKLKGYGEHDPPILIRVVANPLIDDWENMPEKYNKSMGQSIVDAKTNERLRIV